MPHPITDAAPAVVAQSCASAAPPPVQSLETLRVALEEPGAAARFWGRLGVVLETEPNEAAALGFQRSLEQEIGVSEDELELLTAIAEAPTIPPAPESPELLELDELGAALVARDDAEALLDAVRTAHEEAAGRLLRARQRVDEASAAVAARARFRRTGAA